MEIENKYSPQNNKYLPSGPSVEAGFQINKNIVRIMGVIGGGASLANLLINKNKKDLIELSNELNKESNKLKDKIYDLENSQSETKTSIMAKLTSLKEEMVEMKKQVDKIKEKLNKKNDTDIVTEEEIKTDSDLQYSLTQINVNWEKTVDFAKEIEKEMNK
jgi:seryl-tRNA synthetase